MLWHPKTLQNLAMHNVFFIFGRFSIAGKLPKWPKIPFQYPLALRHPKILEKCRKHHRILVSVRNRFWPPPAKADIATAILTNVIEHLVLLLPPNKHAFTAKAVWADLHILFAIMKCVVVMSSHSFQLHFLKFYLCCLIGSADCVRETAVARLNHVARWCSECITAKQRPADHPRTLAMPFVESLRLCEM